MNKKYELTDETKKLNSITLHRIRALRNFDDVEEGELGGWIEEENNLSHKGNCWVYGDAKIGPEGYINSIDSYITIGPIGSRDDYTTFYLDKDRNIWVKCGCFNDTIDKFKEEVIKVHKDNKYAKQYLAAIELAKIKLL